MEHWEKWIKVYCLYVAQSYLIAASSRDASYFSLKILEKIFSPFKLFLFVKFWQLHIFPT